MQALYLRLAQRFGPQWVLKRDIKGFFENLNHNWLLENIPINKDVLEEWLKAGVLDQGEFHETTAGVPQGGVISPILANIMLDGLEPFVLGNLKPREKNWRAKITLVRYADDLVVTGATPRLLEKQVKPRIQEYLESRGLELHPEKIALTNVKDGFDFLGYNFKEYPDQNKARGYSFLVKPSKSSISKLKAKVKEIFKGAYNYSPEGLILKLNPILRGWAYYRQPAVAKEVYS